VYTHYNSLYIATTNSEQLKHKLFMQDAYANSGCVSKR